MTEQPTPTPTPTPTPPWYQSVEGVTPDLTGHLQNRGWDKLTPAQAAVQAAQAHRSAEQMIGIPENQRARIPLDANDKDGWNALYTRLGRPVDAKGYDLSSVKSGDKPLDQETADFLSQTAFALNLSKDAGLRFAQDFVKRNESLASKSLAERTAAVQGQKDELKTNWKVNYDANLTVAQNAAKALGVTAEVLEALEGQIGYAKTMEMFRNIGTKIGEDKFIQGDGSTTGGIMTRDQAVTRKNTLMKDDGWVKRYMSGDIEANNEMQSLLKIITENGARAA